MMCMAQQRQPYPKNDTYSPSTGQVHPTQRLQRQQVRPYPTDKEVEEEHSPTQRTSPMLRLRDPTTIEVSPSTRMAGEVEGVEGKGVEMGGKDATHTKVEEGRSHALRFRLFFLILHVLRHRRGNPHGNFIDLF
jgi:hypothetical protein